MNWKTDHAVELGLEGVLAARERVAPHLRQTPVLTSEALDQAVGAQLFFKAEHLQETGAFKIRGAVNAVFALEEAAARRGVATHSSGNHAGALAYAARRRGIPCRVVMPTDAPAVKRDLAAAFGAEIHDCAPGAAARSAAASALVERTGSTLIHPYDDDQVIAGQATCALEFVSQVEALDAVIAPIGGGGLIAGTCLALRATAPETRVLAAEPDGADDAFRSFQAGRRVAADDAPHTVADGLRAPLSPRTWAVLAAHAASVLTVSDPEIIEATRLVWRRLKQVVEPSAAVPLAALLKHRDALAGQRIGVILTGGNLDVDAPPWTAPAR